MYRNNNFLGQESVALGVRLCGSQDFQPEQHNLQLQFVEHDPAFQSDHLHPPFEEDLQGDTFPPDQQYLAFQSDEQEGAFPSDQQDLAFQPDQQDPALQPDEGIVIFGNKTNLHFILLPWHIPFIFLPHYMLSKLLFYKYITNTSFQFGMYFHVQHLQLLTHTTHFRRQWSKKKCSSRCQW